MDRDKIVVVALIAAVLAVLPKMECQPRRPIILPLPPPVEPRPLCASQFSLANYACSLLPYPPPSLASLTSPLSPNDDDDVEEEEEEESEHRHGHRHGHRRRHSHRHKERPEEKNCCRWLKEVDNECVCELLVHLPILLARPAHKYSVIVDDSCNVTFTCNGRLRP